MDGIVESLEAHFRLQAGELVVNGGAVGDGGVLLLQVGDIVGRILVELGHGIGGVEHAVGLGLHAVERGDGALGAVGARGEAGDLLLRLGAATLALMVSRRLLRFSMSLTSLSCIWRIFLALACAAS